MTIKGASGPADPPPPLAADQAVPSRSSTASWINRWFERHWLFTFNTAWGVFVILPWLAPIFMVLGLTFPGLNGVPKEQEITQAQIAEAWGVPLTAISNELVRRQFVGTPELGWKVAWSDRMVAMYTSIFIFGLIYAVLRKRGIRFKGISWWVFLLLILPMAIDGTTHLINDALRFDFRQTNQWAVILTNNTLPASFYAGDMFGSLNSVLRIVTGILFGFGVVAFLWPLMDNEFSAKKR